MRWRVASRRPVADSLAQLLDRLALELAGRSRASSSAAARRRPSRDHQRVAGGSLRTPRRPSSAPGRSRARGRRRSPRGRPRAGSRGPASSASISEAKRGCRRACSRAAASCRRGRARAEAAGGGRPRARTRTCRGAARRSRAVLLVEVDDDFGVALRSTNCARAASSSAAQLAVVVDLAVEDDPEVPSSLKIGWSPVARSMTRSRWMPRATLPRGTPRASGPRCSSAAHICSGSSGSTGSPEGGLSDDSAHPAMQRTGRRLFRRGRAALSETFVWMPMQGRPDLSVIVVTHQGRDLALRILRTGQAAAGPIDVEWLVVDSGSTDGTPDAIERELPGVTVIRRPDTSASRRPTTSACASRGAATCCCSTPTSRSSRAHGSSWSPRWDASVPRSASRARSRTTPTASCRPLYPPLSLPQPPKLIEVLMLMRLPGLWHLQEDESREERYGHEQSAEDLRQLPARAP